MRGRSVFRVLAALGCLTVLLAIPTSASAQSAIAGVVKDSSGGVLPGVTVEAASDALIEKSKTVVTDGAGAYKIIDLRPGTYLITFTLTGFQTFKREGLELPSDFVATVDAAMKVGSLEESVTVSGASPVVDVQSNVKSQVLPRDVLDSVPNAHTLQSIGQLIPGVTLTSPDVGGSVQMQQTYFSVHGTGAAGTSMTVDGMIVNGLMSDGAVLTYMNEALAQEMVYRTGGGGGEQQTGGLQISIVPREGGNRFNGSASLGFENWQSDNFAQELKDKGVTSVDKLGNYHDLSASEGGPVVKDRLWWFLSGRLSLENKPVANTTNVAAYGPQPITNANVTDYQASFSALTACRAAQAAAAGSCPQGISDEKVNNLSGRFTIQVSAKNKLSGYYDRSYKDRASAIPALGDQRVTGVHWDSPNYSTHAAKWTSTLSNRLLLQGGWSNNIERYNNKYQPGIEQPRFTPLWYSMVSRQNSTDGTRFVAGATEIHNYPDRYNLQASASYVTGTHSVQIGFQNSWGPYNLGNFANGDMSVQYGTVNGVPNKEISGTIESSDARWEDHLDSALGIYAQDNWTMKRITVNYGIRWDYLSESYFGQPLQAGVFAVSPAFPSKTMPIQKNWEPHVSIVADLFGNGKTALRAGFNRFANSATTSLAASQDPGRNQTSARPWTDVNGDGLAEYQVTHDPTTGQLISTCTYATLGCELNFSTLSASYGANTITNVQDPGLLRGYQNKFNVGVSHELMKGVSISAEWFRTDNKNLSNTYNLARLRACGGITPATGLSVADSHTLIDCNEALDPTTNPLYQAFTVFSPIDGHAVQVFDVASSAVSSAATQNFVYTDTNPAHTSVYNGVDVGFNARLPRGGRLFGGTTTERTLSANCNTAAVSPGSLLYCDDANLGGGYTIPWKTQIKLAGTFPLPWLGLILNGSYQGLPGYTIGQTTYSLSTGSGGTKYLTCPGNSVAAGCVVGARVAPTQVTTSLNVQLDPSNVTQTPRTNQVDFGLAKRIKIGRMRIDPKVDMFNALNSHDYYSVTTSAFSPILDPSLPAATAVTSPALPSNASGTNFPGYHQPSRFLQGRIYRLGANITW